MEKRTGEVTMKGNPITLLGKKLKVGDKAPDFTVQDLDFSAVKLSDFSGKIVIINAVPSVDTSVCSAQLHRFNSEAAKFTNVAILSVSADLPFALSRYCAADGIDAIKVTSDHKDLDFGLKYGLVIEALRLLSRAVFVINQQGKIVYLEYVDEVSHEPDYTRVLNAVKAL
ncbi:thiol peroxidase [Utexia brackfieldae]|uniref:thiol peroxidase n=1 Tax=Utexia brackfieldae TaxID=3074108 RepID=UPI00370DBB04